MYILKQENGTGAFYLKEDKDYIIGRKNADFVLPDDQSISRKHAILTLSNESLTLTDCGSKYSTDCNGRKLSARTPVRLKEKDIIKFGVYQSIYMVERFNIVTTGSGLDNTVKNELKKKITKLGGQVLSDWDDTCTHLTADQIMLTVKVLLALIHEKPFVTMKYWDQFIANVNAGLPVPNTNDYKPRIAETLINRLTFETQHDRRNLFTKKVFVFPTQKLRSKMEDLIVKTGGDTISWDIQPLSLLQITNSPKDYIFIHCEDVKNLPQSLKDTHQYIMKQGQRTIPIQEIAMAVVLCSTEKDCNPYFNRVERVFIEEDDNGGFSEVFSLAPETESEDSMLSPKVEKQEIIIPGTLDADLMPPPSFSREPTPSTSSGTPKRHSDEEPVGHPFKKVKQEISAEKTNTKKRKNEELEESPPIKRSELRQNPFAVLKNKNSVKKASGDNPFVQLRVKQEISTNNSPFRQCLVNKENEENDRMELSTNGDSQPNELNDTGSSSGSDFIWRDKTIVTKIEESIIEPGFEAIFDRFKDIFVMEAYSVTTSVVQSQNCADESLFNTPNGRNFKKFSKAKLLRPQRNIINTSENHVKAEPEIFSAMEEDDDEVVRPVVKRTATKVYTF